MDSPTPPSRRDAFGLVFACAAIALVAWLVFDAPVVGAIVASVGALGLIATLARWRPWAALAAGWAKLGGWLAGAVSFALLTVVYYGVVTPTALLRRTFGRSPVTMAPDPSLDTYWIARDPAEDDVDRTFRQY